MPQRLKSLHPQKIAIIRRNGIGDLLMTLPLLRWCRSRWQAELLLVVGECNEEAARWIEDPPWSQLLKMPRGFKYLQALRLCRQLRFHQLDLIVSGKPSPMKLMSFLLAFSGASLKRAVTGGEGFGSWLLEKGINWPLPKEQLACFEHQALAALNLLWEGDEGESRPTHFDQLDRSLWPRMRRAPQRLVEAFEERRLGFDRTLPTLYLNLTNSRPSNAFALGQIMRVVRQLGGGLHLVLGVLPSGREEVKLWEEALKKELIGSVISHVGHDLPSTLAVLEKCDLVLTGDGGLMHLAAACARPMVALFGETSLARWRPLTDQAHLFEHPQGVDQIDSKEIARAIVERLRGGFPRLSELLS